MKKSSVFSNSVVKGWLIVIGIFAVGLCCPVYVALSLGYSETKGPFKNSTQVVDLEGDGDLDVLVSHTRWEENDLSWAGVGRWINQGYGVFELIREEGTNYFAGFAAGAGDFDQDWDADVLVQGFGIRLLQNQGGLQGGEPGKFMSSGGINSPPAYSRGYRDMGGTIISGDLNGDGWLDAFIAGCCYGANPREPGFETPNSPSTSWVWINDGREKFIQKGHILPIDSLDGIPIRQAAFGDLNGDGDLDVFAAVGKPTMGDTVRMDDLIFLNDGAGSLTRFDQPLGETDSTSIALGDVNGDGSLDALVGASDGARLWINQSDRVKNGGPIFIPAEQTFAAEQPVWNKLQAGLSAAAGRLFGLYLPFGSIRTKAVSLSDLDSDEDLDALIARTWGAEVWWNDGRGQFNRSNVGFNYPEDTGVAAADFDGDGDRDIFSGGNQENLRVWWNDGKGTFIPSIH